MARNYDLQDPTDIEILKADFESVKSDEWKAYIEFATHAEERRVAY